MVKQGYFERVTVFFPEWRGLDEHMRILDEVVGCFVKRKIRKREEK